MAARFETWRVGTLVVACAVAVACGESVKPGGGARGDAGASSGGDAGSVAGVSGTDAFAGAGTEGSGDGGGDDGGAGDAGAENAGAGGSAGASAAGAETGGDGSSGTGGIAAGNGGSIAGGGATGGAGTGGLVTNGGAGAGSGGAPVPDTLPTCITDLYEECWPEGACTLDEATGTRCYESGVRVVTEPDADGCFPENATTTYYKPDGAVCFEHVDDTTVSHACETHVVTWADASGTIVADQSQHYMNPPQPPKLYPTCRETTATPCTGDRCVYPSAEACAPGTCPPVN